MSSNLFLTEDEMLELTECTRAADRIRVLEENGIPHTITSKGKPRVARAWFENPHRPGGGGYAEEPDFGYLDRLGR